MTVVVQRKPILGLILLVVCNFFLLSVQVRSERGELLLRSWGLTLFTATLVAEAEKAARDFALIQRSAADYERARNTEARRVR